MSSYITSVISSWTPSPIKSLAAHYGADGLAFLAFAGVQNMLVQTICDDIESDEYSVSKTGVAAISAIVVAGAFIRAARERFHWKIEADKARQKILPILESDVPKEEEDQRDIVLWVWTAADHNSAFSLSNESQIDKIKLISKKFKVEYLEVYALDQITEKMQSLQPRKIKHLIISAHGSKDLVHLSGLFSPCLLRKDWITKEHFPGLDNQAHIILDACETGLPDGLAEEFSRVFPKASVYANASSSYSSRTWFVLDKERKPGMISLSARNGEMISRLFQNGVPIDQPANESIKDYFSERISVGPSIASEKQFEDVLYSSAILSSAATTQDMLRSRRLHDNRMNRMREGSQQTFDQIEQSMLGASLETIQGAQWQQAVCDLIALLHAESQKDSFTMNLAEDGNMERQKKLFTAVHASDPKLELSLGLIGPESRLGNLEQNHDSLTPDEVESACDHIAYMIYHWYVTYGASNPDEFQNTTDAVKQLINRIKALKKTSMEQAAAASEAESG